jgi:hypothetical protein
MKMRQGPSFIGIGASHAGLTQITKWLSEHEAIADTIPAVNFFNTEAYTKKGLDWYETTVSHGYSQSDCLYGDVSSSYLVSSQTPNRIASTYSNTKLFVVVRHPLKRAVATYLARQKIDKKAQTLSAAAYLSAEPVIQLESCYADHLAHYYEYYAPVNLHVVVYEDLVADPLKTMSELYAYLEVDKNFIPKSLRHLAPPPEPPKHPGLIKRAIMRGKKIYKKLTVRPVGPLFDNDPNLSTLLTEAECTLFLQSMYPATDRLSHLLGRDMVAFWELR